MPTGVISSRLFCFCYIVLQCLCCVCAVLCYTGFRGMFHVKPGYIMATETVKKMDELSKEDRSLIFDALTVRLAVLKRSIAAEKDLEVKALREVAWQRTVAMQGRFL